MTNIFGGILKTMRKELLKINWVHLNNVVRFNRRICD
jgi:hypothetical protein